MSWRKIFDAADEGGSDEKLGIGMYVLEVTAAKQTVTKAGNPRWLFTLECPEGVAWKGVNVPYDGCKPGMFHFFREEMQTLGLTAEMLDADVDQALATTVGKRFSVIVKQRDQWTDVELYRPAEGEELGRRGDALQPGEAGGGPAPEPSAPWEQPF